MAESEVDEYKLDTNQGKKHHTFRVSLINDRVNLLITNMDNPNEKHSNLVRLEQLRSACEAFDKTKTIKEALFLIKDTIENSRILISEDEEAGNIDIKFNIRVGKKNYSPFVIGLPLDDPPEEEGEDKNEAENSSKRNDVEVLPTKFDYQGDLEAEAKYGQSMKNTTEYVNPIIKSNVKEPNLILEYIEPILQVHYPDGTTKSTPLPPRLQTADGKKPNINPEQLKSIHEQMTKSFNQSISEFEKENNRANSVSHKNGSTYSRQTVSSFRNNNNNNILRTANSSNINNGSNNANNNVNNAVRSALKSSASTVTFNNRLNNIRSARTAVNAYDNERGTDTSTRNMVPRDNYGNHRQNQINSKGISDYATSSVPNKPLIIPNYNYGSIPYPTIKNNLNNSTNFNSNTNQYDQTPIIQEVPISQSQNINFNNMYQKSLNRSSSSPSMATIDKVNHNFYQQNQNYTQLMYQQNQNPNNQAFLQNQINNVNLRYQYQQYDKKDINNNFNFNQTQQYQSKNKKLNISQNTRLNNQTLPQNNTLQRHNSSQAPFDSQSNMQKLQEQQIVQQKQPTQQKSKAKDQKKVDNQKKLQLSQLQKQKMNQIPSQHSSRHGQKKNSKLSQQSSQSHILQKQSQPIDKSRNQQKLEVQPKLKSNYSQKIIRQKPSLKNEITEQQIALAQMASMQNQKNPSNYNVSAVSLDHRFLDREGNEETQSQYEREDQESEQQERVSEQDIKKIEADVFENLYRTETGLIIFRNGLLRGIIHKFAEITDVVSKIQIMLTAGVKFNIIYRASEHGDKAKTFHQKCDNHQMTLVLVETTKGRRFGGFTTKTWDGNCVKKIDNDAFVFSLDKHKIYDVHKNEFAIGGYPKFGPVFFGCQIRIYDEFFKKGGTTCHRTLNYKTKEDYELNSGEQTYIVKEIEVYDIEVIKIT